eukprot:955564-Prorocentrum_minimum.AAC.1
MQRGVIYGDHFPGGNQSLGPSGVYTCAAAYWLLMVATSPLHSGRLAVRRLPASSRPRVLHTFVVTLHPTGPVQSKERTTCRRIEPGGTSHVRGERIYPPGGPVT